MQRKTAFLLLRKMALLIGSISCLFLVITAEAGETPSFNVILGEWLRPDGGYLLSVGDVSTSGEISVRYLNPQPIHVASARVEEWKGLIKIFVKLDDEGYPGSTYTLYYYAEKDALAGFYYQAAIQKTYEVVFIRKE